MALRFNAVTGKMEDDGTAAVRPLTGGPIDLAPDDVKPSDLIVSADPRHPYGPPLLGTTRTVDTSTAASNPPGYTPGDMLPLPGGAPSGDLPPAKLAKQVEPFAVPGDPDYQELAQAPASPGALPPAPVRRGGGGGGGGGTGGHLTADETLAQGGVLTAREEADQATIRAGDVEANKAGAASDLDKAQQKELATFTAQRKEAMDSALKHLQERQEAVAKTPIRDQFEGRPLAHLLAAIAAGVGARAATITGTENTALRVLDSAAAAYRQKQQEMYEREMKGVADEKERFQFASMQAAADEAGLRQRFVTEREAKLREFGASEARIKTDVILADNHLKSAEEQRKNATLLYDRHQNEVLQAAQVASARASAAHAGAETQKTLAETEALKSGNGPGGGKSGAAEMKMGMMAEKGADALSKRDALISRGVALTEADRAKIQRNKQSMARAEHMGLAELTAGQAAGLIAQSPYQGLSPAKQELARNNDVLTQAAAVISSPSAAEDELRNVRGLYNLNAPGQSAESGAGTLDTIRGFIGGAKGLGRGRTTAAAAGAAAEKAAAPPQLSKADIVSLTAEANKRLQANPNDPLALGALERLRKLRAGGGG